MSDLSVFELAFCEDVAVVERTEDSILLRPLGGGGVMFNRLTPGLNDVFDHLFAGGVTEAQLGDAVLKQDGAAGLVRFYQQMHQLDKQAALNHTIRVEDELWATIKPMARHYKFNPNLVNRDQAYQFSRFACCRTDNDTLILESPLGYARIELHSERPLQLLHALTRPLTFTQLQHKHPDLNSDAICLFLNLLLNAKLLAQADETGATDETTDATLAQWNFYDLLFHSRSRMGRHNLPYGGTFRFAKKFPQLPIVKDDLPEGDIIPLAKPDMEQLKETDLTLTAVLENRKSIRNYAETPITSIELGHFLYRTARIKQMMKNEYSEFSLRPYPAGGAIYELELYLVIDNCDGIERGVYYYNPAEHQLHHISDIEMYAEIQLQLAWLTANKQSHPQIYIGITSRFQRLQWKYEGVAYAITLKNVGALYQTMYLVATAMGLAPCALGGGDTDLFGNVAKLDNYFAESLVGEFILGSQGKDPGRAKI